MRRDRPGCMVLTGAAGTDGMVKTTMDDRGISALAALEPLTEAVSGEPTPDLFRKYGASLRAFFRQRLRNDADVEDAVQDTYVRLLRYRDDEAIRSPQALVFRVAECVLLDRHRRSATHHVDRHVGLDATEIVDSLADQEHSASLEQELMLLAEAIGELTPKCRRVFLMSRLHNLTYPEIAAQLGISVQMVAKHISNALTACRRKLGEDAPGGSR